MKLATLLIFIASAAFAQTPSQFHVVRVVGKVESPALRRELKTGDVIQSKDQLRFNTRESYIIVNSPQTGRKRISGVPDASPREFFQLLQSFVQPELKSTASRSISIQYLESLQNSMAFDTMLVLGNGFIPVNTKKLTLTKPAVIRAWHYAVGKKIVYKSISDASGFAITRNIYDNQAVLSLPATTTKLVVEYFEDEKEDPAFGPGILLASFVPMWVDEQQLSTELKALIAALPKSKTKSEQYLEINAYLRDEYAPVQDDNLKAWLKSQGIPFE